MSYRVVLTYCFALSYICMHFFVSFSDFDAEPLYDSNKDEDFSSDSSMRRPLAVNTEAATPSLHFLVNDKNFNSKKLLNFNPLVKKNLNKRNNNLRKVYSSPRRNQSVTSYFKRIAAAPTDRIKFDEPKPDTTYNLKNKTSIYFSQILQDRILQHLISTRKLNEANASTEGLFVEAGAYDGETWSNTLYLEKSKNWTGLLVEPSVDNFRVLKQKGRNAYSVNNCLCAGEASINSTYIEAGPYGITTNVSASSSSSSSTSSQSPVVICHPLTKILDQFFESFKQFATKKSKFVSEKSGSQQPSDAIVLDYLSLDIEGSERAIIETFRWDKYRFNFLNIEYNQDRELYEWLRTFLRRYGYSETVVDDVWHQDAYFAHKAVMSDIDLGMRKVSQFVTHFS
jgi:hypothetical protein